MLGRIVFWKWFYLFLKPIQQVAVLTEIFFFTVHIQQLHKRWKKSRRYIFSEKIYPMGLIVNLLTLKTYVYMSGRYKE